MNTTTSLGEQLPIEMARVRDTVLPFYLEIGLGGSFGAMTIRAALDNAARSMAEGDVVAMIRAYKELKEIELS